LLVPFEVMVLVLFIGEVLGFDPTMLGAESIAWSVDAPLLSLLPIWKLKCPFESV
jgi:hypothetical protein